MNKLVPMSISEFEDKFFSTRGEWCKWLKDNILDVLKHGRTESTTARPWYSPRPCSHPGSIPAKYPVLCIQFANLLVGKLLIFLYGFVAFEVSFQANQEACQSESDKSFNKGLNLRLSRFACLLHGLGDWTDSPPNDVQFLNFFLALKANKPR